MKKKEEREIIARLVDLREYKLKKDECIVLNFLYVEGLSPKENEKRQKKLCKEQLKILKKYL